MNHSQDLPLQIHHHHQSSAPQGQHKRNKTEGHNNNVYHRKRESRNNQDTIQKVLPVKLLKYKNNKGFKTQKEDDKEKFHKRRMT
jgi:hypothetical protein